MNRNSPSNQCCAIADDRQCLQRRNEKPAAEASPVVRRRVLQNKAEKRRTKGTRAQHFSTGVTMLPAARTNYTSASTTQVKLDRSNRDLVCMPMARLPGRPARGNCECARTNKFRCSCWGSAGQVRRGQTFPSNAGNGTQRGRYCSVWEVRASSCFSFHGPHQGPLHGYAGELHLVAVLAQRSCVAHRSFARGFRNVL